MLLQELDRRSDQVFIRDTRLDKKTVYKWWNIKKKVVSNFITALFLTLFSYKLICHVRQIAHFLDKSLTLIVLKHERNAARHTKKF